MQVSSDYEDLFKTLNAYKIRYLVVGGYAVMYHTEPRYTKDIDVWIIPEMNVADKIYDALKNFGAPLVGISPEDFKDKKMILQIGVAPVRIDIMVDLPEVSFESAWKNRKRVKYGNTSISVLGIAELIKAKKGANRAQDKLDLEKLSNNREKRKK